jgi:uncharacterized membrane protein YkoI
MKHARDLRTKTQKASTLVKASSVTIDQAVTVALTSVKGAVVDAKLKEKDRRVVWRIKLLGPSGLIKLHIDGRSGKLLDAFAETVSVNGEDTVGGDLGATAYPSSLETTAL